MKKRVFIVEDEENTRKLLVKIVSNIDQLQAIAAVASLAEARKQIALHGYPDVLLADLGLPDGSGVDLIREVREAMPQVEIMVVSSFGDEENVVNAIEAGANGYIHKDEPLHEIGIHIQAILRGESPISPSIAKYILKRIQSDAELDNNLDILNEIQLTSREKEVLNILARGYSRVEIATNLQVSPHTVTTHMKNIYGKLGVGSRTEAVFEACQRGIIQLHD